MTVTKRKPKPITAHPMFPAVTALWFAVFLSLGSFALAPALLEGPVVALGIPEILPAAQPPLGFTVRALVAIVMLGAGGLVGYLIGRRLARGKVEAPVRARSFGRSANSDVANARQPMHRPPLNPSEDLGDPMGDAAFAPPSVIAAEAAPETPAPDVAEQAVLEVTRLPWEDDYSDADQGQVFAGDKIAHDPLALDLLFEDAEIVAEEVAVDERQQFVANAEVADEFGFDSAEPAEDPTKEPVVAEVFVQAEDFANPAPERTAMPLIQVPLMQAPTAAPAPLARTPLDELGLVQLTERLALAIGRRHAHAQAAPQHTAAMAPYAVPAVDSFAQVPTPEAAVDTAPAPELSNVFDKTPNDLTVDHDVDVGGNSAEFSVVAPQQAPTLVRFKSAAADADVQVPSFETERVVQLRPAALQPFTPELDAEDDEDVPGLARFLRVPEQPLANQLAAYEDDYGDGDEFGDEEHEGAAPTSFQAEEGSAEPEVAEERYPSLLDMGTGGNRHQPLQFSHDEEDGDGEGGIEVAGQAMDAEPVVIFPGQSSPIHAPPRPFERPSAGVGASALPTSIIPVPGSPLASPGRAAPSSPIDSLVDSEASVANTIVEAEEADRALRAALATLQRMTAQG